VNGIKCGHKDFFLSVVTAHEVLLPRNSTQGGEEQGPIRTGGTRKGASRAQESSAAIWTARSRQDWARAHAPKGLLAAMPCGAAQGPHSADSAAGSRAHGRRGRDEGPRLGTTHRRTQGRVALQRFRRSTGQGRA
jgi:hypothetical protein